MNDRYDNTTRVILALATLFVFVAVIAFAVFMDSFASRTMEHVISGTVPDTALKAGLTAQFSMVYALICYFVVFLREYLRPKQ